MTAAALYDWLLLGHVLAAMAWVGGTLVIGAFATRVLHEDDATATARFLAMLRVVAPRVLAPAPGVLVALGIWMVLDSPAVGFDQLWIQLALGAFAAAFVVGAAHQSRAAIAAARAAEHGDATAARRHLTRWVWGMRVIVVLLVLATADMVLKPGL